MDLRSNLHEVGKIRHEIRFTIKNTVPDMPNNEKTLLLQSISDDLKRALQRISA